MADTESVIPEDSWKKNSLFISEFKIEESIVNRGNNLKRSWGFIMFLMGVTLLLIVLLVSFIPMLVVYKVLQAYSSSFEFFIFSL